MQPQQMDKPFSIRPAVKRDAPEIARLLSALGHPTSADGIAGRWVEWAEAGNAALVAVGSEGTLAGLATLHRMVVLHRPKPVGRITALVVDTSLRGRGIGRALVAAAEEALILAGCGILEVTSNARLVDAHAFYEHLGYERTSVRFAKDLVSSVVAWSPDQATEARSGDRPTTVTYGITKIV